MAAGSSRNRQRRGQPSGARTKADEATNKMYKDRHRAPDGRHKLGEDVLIVLKNGTNSLLDRKRLQNEGVNLSSHAIERFIERMYNPKGSVEIKVPPFLNKNAQGFTFRPWTGKGGQKPPEWKRIKTDKLQEILAYVLKRGTPQGGREKYNAGKLAAKSARTCPSVRISKLYELPNKEGDKRRIKRCITAVVEACYPKQFGNPEYGKITVLTVIGDDDFCKIDARSSSKLQPESTSNKRTNDTTTLENAFNGLTMLRKTDNVSMLSTPTKNKKSTKKKKSKPKNP